MSMKTFLPSLKRSVFSFYSTFCVFSSAPTPAINNDRSLSEQFSRWFIRTRQKSRRKRWQGKGHLSGSESENEVSLIVQDCWNFSPVAILQLKIVGIDVVV